MYLAAVQTAVNLVSMKMDRLSQDEDQLDKASIKDITISAGILKDHSDKAHGEATTIHHKHSISFEDYQESIRQAKARLVPTDSTITTQPIDNQPVIDITPSTD